MTHLDLVLDEKLSRLFEPCLINNIRKGLAGGLPNDRDNGGDSGLFFLLFVKIPAYRCEQGEVR